MIYWKPIPDYLYSRWGTNEKEFRDFVAAFGFDRYARAPIINNAWKFLNCKKGANPVMSYSFFEEPPYLEHSVAFHKTGTTRRMWIYHPYIPRKPSCTLFEVTEALESWCNVRDIVYVLCPPNESFYAPNWTHMVMLMSASTYTDCLSIPAFHRLQK